MTNRRSFALGTFALSAMLLAAGPAPAASFHATRSPLTEAPPAVVEALALLTRDLGAALSVGHDAAAIDARIAAGFEHLAAAHAELAGSRLEVVAAVLEAEVTLIAPGTMQWIVQRGNELDPSVGIALAAWVEANRGVITVLSDEHESACFRQYLACLRAVTNDSDPLEAFAHSLDCQITLAGCLNREVGSLIGEVIEVMTGLNRAPGR
jgi:hypothetical protein